MHAALRLTLAFICFVAMHGLVQAAETWDANQALQALAQTPSSHVRFSEKKYLSVLKQPLESSGELLFIAPEHLEKRTLLPKPETLVLDNKLLTIERDRKKMSLSIADYPELGVLVDSLRALLAGNRERLERSYRIEFRGRREQWQMALLPADVALAAVVSNIRIAGHDNHIDNIEILQANGDRSLMNIFPLADEH